MSTRYKIGDEVPSDIICKRLNVLSDAVTNGQKGIAREFYMSIPAQCDHDADLILSAASKRISDLENKLKNTYFYKLGLYASCEQCTSAHKSYSDWWDRVGSSMQPLNGEDTEKHVGRVCRAAWIKARDEHLTDIRLGNIVYKFARLLRNTDNIHPCKWGIDGLKLLEKLLDLDPWRYNKEVK